MPNDPIETVSSSSSFASVPRVIWVAGAVLSLVIAALAGALVMKSMQPGSQVEAAAPAQFNVATSDSNPGAVTASPVPPNVAQPVKPRAIRHAIAGGTNVAQEGEASPPSVAARDLACPSCGTVESVIEVRHKGEGTGLGAVAGGVLGGVVGHQVGGGSGKSVMTVLGAIGGGLAGNEVERRTRSQTAFDIHVRMDDGSSRVIRQSEAIAVGAHVHVEGNRVRLAAEPPLNGPVPTQTAAPSQTSAPNQRGG